jgi:hypothetical protein
MEHADAARELMSILAQPEALCKHPECAERSAQRSVVFSVGCGMIRLSTEFDHRRGGSQRAAQDKKNHASLGAPRLAGKCALARSPF